MKPEKLLSALLSSKRVNTVINVDNILVYFYVQIQYVTTTSEQKTIITKCCFPDDDSINMCHCICVHAANAEVHGHFANIPLSDRRPKDLDHAAFFHSIAT